jgi:hypothetical protein
MTQGSEAQFRGRRGPRLLQLLDIGRDIHALDRRDLRDAVRRKPVEEFFRRARIGAARVGIPDLRGEEFKEAVGGTLAGGGGEGRGAVADDGDELVHFLCFHHALTRRNSSFKSRLMPMKVGLSVSISFG